MVGYRLITTTYTYIPTLEEAKSKALRGRGEGKRTEIITEDDYRQNYMKPKYNKKLVGTIYPVMQDLTTIEVELQLYDAIKAFADKWGFSFNEVCELIGEQA